MGVAPRQHERFPCFPTDFRHAKCLVERLRFKLLQKLLLRFQPHIFVELYLGKNFGYAFFYERNLVLFMLEVFLLRRLKVVDDQLLNVGDLPVDFVEFGFMCGDSSLLFLNLPVAGDRSLSRDVANDVMKKRQQPVIVFLRYRIELMVVTATAAHGEP